MLKVASLVMIGLITVLSFSFAPVMAPVPPVPDPAGFCLNRHDASFRSVVIHNTDVNYTGSGDEVLAHYWTGYQMLVILRVEPGIMTNPQPDTTNGSIYFGSDIMGTWTDHCFYGIPPEGFPALVIPYSPSNLTGYGLGYHQPVYMTTGTHSGGYNVSWVD